LTKWSLAIFHIGFSSSSWWWLTKSCMVKHGETKSVAGIPLEFMGHCRDAGINKLVVFDQVLKSNKVSNRHSA
jgi:hypothetical protein